MTVEGQSTIIIQHYMSVKYFVVLTYFIADRREMFA